MRLNGYSKILNGVLSAGCCLAVLLAIISPAFGEAPKRTRSAETKVIQLPEPNKSGSVSLEEAIRGRGGVKQFTDKPLDFTQMGQLAWAGVAIYLKVGISASSAELREFPIELYFVTPDGMFVYHRLNHSFEQIVSTDLRNQLSSELRDTLTEATCDIVIAGSTRKLAPRSVNKAEPFLLIEAGQVAENIQLQAIALGLTSVPIGDFDVRSIAKVCKMSGDLKPLLIVSVGHPLVQQKTQEQAAVQTAKKAVIIVSATQYADAELADIQGVLKEAGIITVVASSKIGTLNGAFGGIATSEIAFDKLKVEDFNAVVFIGGYGAADYFNNQAVFGIAREASARNKVIAAISDATTILANAGVLRGIRATCLPQQQDQMKKVGAKYTGSPVERDGLIITANDSSVAVQFARAIVTALKANQPKSDKKPAK